MATLRPSALQLHYRAARDWRLRPFEELTPVQQAWLRPLRLDPRFFGVLEPRLEGHGVQAVSRPTARLLRRLARPGVLPGYFLQEEGKDALRAAARLVLDGILEVEIDQGFVSGPAAHPTFFAEGTLATPRNAMGRLSRAALHYGASLRMRDIPVLAARLYRYNTEPATPALRRKFPNRDSVRRMLGGQDAALASDSRSHWLIWTPPRPGPPVAGRRHYKLYLSTPLAHLPGVVHRVLGLLRKAEGVDSAKVGATLPGLTRPDKFVVYFARRRDLQVVARTLRSELDGVPAQGVPFTAGLDPAGLLSWGAEPAGSDPAPAGRQEDSWRTRIATRLAASMAAAFAVEKAPVQPWRFALDRLSLDGVNPATWAPGSAFHWDRRLPCR